MLEAVEPVDASSAGAFQLLTVEDLLAMPDPGWLIGGLVPDTGTSVLYGAPGSRKSFLGLAMSIATGRQWLGHEVEQHSVVDIATEDAAGLKVRTQAWLNANGRPDASRIRFHANAVNLRGPRRHPARQVRRPAVPGSSRRAAPRASSPSPAHRSRRATSSRP